MSSHPMLQEAYAEAAVTSAPFEVAREDKLVLPVYQFRDNVVAPASKDKTIIERSSNLSRHSPHKRTRTAQEISR